MTQPTSQGDSTAPDLLVHADWGSSPSKRWMCVATRQRAQYEIQPPQLVGDLSSFWRRIVERAGGRRTLVGFDFPIGLPSAYAERAGISKFKAALPEFGRGDWSDFYSLAERPSQISIRRPFYPRRPGGTKQQHLVDGLQVERMFALLRRCERPTRIRGQASPLFWTLGGKQVGRAAIIGWRYLLAPGLADSSINLKLWPFDGNLCELVAPGSVVVAETYPAEACIHLGLTPPGRNWRKTSQQGRKAQAGGLIEWARSRSFAIDGRLEQLICDGFGPERGAEDPFDAMLGVMSMLEVVMGFREEGVPSDTLVRMVEGWILGQDP